MPKPKKRTKKSREGLILAEKERLSAIFAHMDEKTAKIAENLIEKAAFMSATLDELQDVVNAEGPIQAMTNGNGFEVVSEHPAVKSYANMVAKYNAVIKTLSDMLPDNKAREAAKAGEELRGFIKAGKPGIG